MHNVMLYKEACMLKSDRLNDNFYAFKYVLVYMVMNDKMAKLFYQSKLLYGL